jgi:hypothetical protein
MAVEADNLAFQALGQDRFPFFDNLWLKARRTVPGRLQVNLDFLLFVLFLFPAFRELNDIHIYQWLFLGIPFWVFSEGNVS